MTTEVPDPSPGASSLPLGAVEQELLAVATRWAEAIVANDAACIAAFVTEVWVMVSDAGIFAGQRFLALVASGELTHFAISSRRPRRLLLRPPP